ncbi:MAG: hypothetical protein HFJ30_03310 [Clostridia bacterium]|jgi:hypothetical protein|nr:hypothetical protein [Clostridia bacterium]MCI9413315.1 hypothetical protein [Clostridia bacterium]
MGDDMSEMIQKVSEMLKNNEIPDNIKTMMNNFASEQNNSSASQENSSNTTDSQEQRNSDNSFEMPNIDLNTMLKMKSIVDSMNRQQNDPRANLLRSLKPYLKPSRKEKVDQYIKLFSMGKVFEVLNPLGGEKKNDV